MTGEPVVQLEAVGHRYRDSAALSDISLALPAGKMLGLIGPDGVGKSTLLGLIAGARRIQSGRIEVLGGDMAVRRHRSAICARIAYMPQGLGTNLYMDLTVAENLGFFGRLFGQDRDERRARIRDLLAATGLAPFAGRQAGKLSGGMKQKLGLCCALIHDPDLLILDEPTTGVDPLSRRQFWTLIARIRRQRPGMSVIVATAYMEEAEGFDWLVAMNGGRVLAAGTPDQLKGQGSASDLEQAFVALMTGDREAGRRVLQIPPHRRFDGKPAIVARELTRRFGSFTAVDQVSFTIERGEIFGFLGSNGCGKTTTMKMLTGLLPPSEGEAWLFGVPAKSHGLGIRKRVGYMSQSFSLYGELTVRQNLELHARLFHLPGARVKPRIEALLAQFDLAEHAGSLAAALPLGVRQRLSLAVAIIHEPEILILDEPTSGVDPLARDAFWALLIDLSRNQGVTIFISTHFMNEAERCDRISLMHAGQVLVTDRPSALVRSRGAASLDQAFVAYLEEATGETTGPGDSEPAQAYGPKPSSGTAKRFDRRRALAYSLREAMEILRDPIRLAFALAGTVILMLVFGYGITFDVEKLTYAVLDQDRSPQSRAYLEGFRGSRYFNQRPPLGSQAEMDRRLRSAEITLALELPPGFGKDLARGRAPVVAAWIDGAMPFRAETVRGYVQGVHLHHLGQLAAREAEPKVGPVGDGLPVELEPRFRYNQDFKSVFAMVPSNIALLLVFIPAILMALGVVREKELGSISNLYVTPVTRLEFLLGKQLPYVILGMINFLILVAMAILVFGVALKGSFWALTLAALLYVTATTGLGLLISSFTKTQVAALFGTAIATTLPAIQFSGMLQPVTSLDGAAAAIGQIYPTTHFLKISVGSFTKALGFAELGGELFALAAAVAVLTSLSLLLLREQER